VPLRPLSSSHLHLPFFKHLPEQHCDPEEHLNPLRSHVGAGVGGAGVGSGVGGAGVGSGVGGAGVGGSGQFWTESSVQLDPQAPKQPPPNSLSAPQQYLREGLPEVRPAQSAGQVWQFSPSPPSHTPFPHRAEAAQSTAQRSHVSPPSASHTPFPQQGVTALVTHWAFRHTASSHGPVAMHSASDAHPTPMVVMQLRLPMWLDIVSRLTCAKPAEPP